MQGLIVKDLLNIKKQLLYYIIFIGVYFMIAINADFGGLFGTMVVILCAMLPIAALAYDERAKWDRYALSMPVSRRDIVVSKYLLGLIFCGGAFVLNVLLQLVTGAGGEEGIWYRPVIYAVSGLFFLTVLLPLMIRFGVERGRLLMILAAFLPAMAITALPTIAGESFVWLFSAISMFALVLISGLCFIASIFLSIRIYSKKEIE